MPGRPQLLKQQRRVQREGGVAPSVRTRERDGRGGESYVTLPFLYIGARMGEREQPSKAFPLFNLAGTTRVPQG